jgi:hypothetical protein
LIETNSTTVKQWLDAESWSHQKPTADDLWCTLKINNLDEPDEALFNELAKDQSWVTSGQGKYMVISSMLLFQKLLYSQVQLARQV